MMSWKASPENTSKMNKCYMLLSTLTQRLNIYVWIQLCGCYWRRRPELLWQNLIGVGWKKTREKSEVVTVLICQDCLNVVPQTWWLEQWKCIVSWFWGLKSGSRCWQVSLLKPVRENFFLSPSFWWCATNPWPSLAFLASAHYLCLYLCIHSLHVCASVSKFLLFKKDTSHVGLGACPMPSSMTSS